MEEPVRRTLVTPQWARLGILISMRLPPNGDPVAEGSPATYTHVAYC